MSTLGATFACAVSACISEDFDDWVNYWKHNGYWFFDSPQIMEALAEEHGISLDRMKLFFYLAYEKQWDDQNNEWVSFEPEGSFATDVVTPKRSTRLGYDVVTFSAQTSAECSPLSCNHMAEELTINSHCLFDSFKQAKQLIESGAFRDREPGPYRMFEVRGVKNA